MQSVRKVTEDIYWLSVNDEGLELFEEFIPIPEGVAYNSYLLVDDKTVLFDTADMRVADKFMANVKYALDGKPLDYLVVQHMEPDHSCCIKHILKLYPNVKVVGNKKTFQFMRQFGTGIKDENINEVVEGDVLITGKHTIAFAFAPMVHWPEVMVSYDTTTGVLFSADAFGSFGKIGAELFSDEVDYDKDWLELARRYYTNIVGKYGTPVQNLLKKAGTLNIKMFLPLHGLVWRENLGYFLDKYNKWSTYEPEEKGVLIIYASMYGNTEKAAHLVDGMLKEKGVNTTIYNVSNTDTAYLISETFRLSHVVIASPTHNMGVFPLMKVYLSRLASSNLTNRTFGIIENSTWAPRAGDIINEFLEKEVNGMTVLKERVKIISDLNEANGPEMENLVGALVKSLES